MIILEGGGSKVASPLKIQSKKIYAMPLYSEFEEEKKVGEDVQKEDIISKPLKERKINFVITL